MKCFQHNKFRLKVLFVNAVGNITELATLHSFFVKFSLLRFYGIMCKRQNSLISYHWQFVS